MKGLDKDVIEELSKCTGKEVPEDDIKEQLKIGRDWMFTLPSLGCSPKLFTDEETIAFINSTLKREKSPEEKALANLTIPPLQKQNITCIRKDDIPQEKVEWTKEDTVKVSKDILKGLTMPCILEENESFNQEWIDKLSDDEAIELASEVAKSLSKAFGWDDDNKDDTFIPEIAADDIKEATKDYETMVTNFQSIFSDKDE